MPVNAYASFNLIVADILRGDMWYYCHTHPDILSPPHPENPTASGPMKVIPGVHGLSNSVLDAPWPKVSKGCAALQRILKECPPGEPSLSALLDLQRDSDRVDEGGPLPVTGMAPHVEHELSAIFTDCHMPEGPFGTRSCVALQVRVKAGPAINGNQGRGLNGDDGSANGTHAGDSQCSDEEANGIADGPSRLLWEVLLVEKYKAHDGTWKEVSFNFDISP